MNGLWSELGKKLADKWLTLLILPGALYLAAITVAITLGHIHPFDIALLTRRVTAHAKDPAVTSVGGQVVLLVAVLAAAAVVGLAAQALGGFVEHVVLAADWGDWPAPARHLTGRWVVRRQRRWDTAHIRFHEEYRKALAPDPPDPSDRPDPAQRRRAARARARIAVERPERPTWSGDRVHAVALRLDRDYHLDLATLWPHLWLVLPDPVRDQITQTRTALTNATTLAAWALLYLPLAVWWWPATPLTVLIALISRYRIRVATDTYAHLLEATTTLHATTLATQLALDHAGPLTPQLGHTLTHHLQHTPPPPPAPA